MPKGLWTALFLMLLGCGMVIASKATAPPKANGQLATPGLWAGRAEEAWLCTSMLGERWGSRLCGLVADPGNGADGEWAGGDADGSGAPRKRAGAAEEPAGGSDTASLVGAPLLEGGAEVEDGRAHRKSGAVGKKPKPGPKPKPKPGPKPKPRPKPHHSSGFGMRDVLGIGLSFFGACCVAGFMTVVQVCVCLFVLMQGGGRAGVSQGKAVQQGGVFGGSGGAGGCANSEDGPAL